MEFTFKEWQFIHYCLETAKREYEQQMNNSNVSDEEYSTYQIFRRQIDRAQSIIDRIDNAVL